MSPGAVTGGGPLRLFALDARRTYGERVAAALGMSLSPHEEREFEWGQHKSRPLASVRGCDVYVIESLHGDTRYSVNDRLCRLVFFLGALRDAGAGRLTAVIPFLCYGRKERQTKPRDPVITRYVATTFEAVGTDRVVTIEAHELAAFQNAFRCRTEHLDARRPVVEFLAREYGGEDLAVVSPDLGGRKRADAYREALARRTGREVSGAVVEKRRSQDTVSGGRLVGDVAGRIAILIDDMIVGGSTLAQAAAACRDAGARGVVAAAPHGAFVPEASAVLAGAPIDRIAILDHIPPAALKPALVAEKVEMLDGARLVGEAIRRLHEDGSLTELLDV